MKKSKKQSKKPSVAKILGFLLLGLVLAGAVANVIIANPFEDKTPTFTLNGGEDDEPVVLEFEDGMTWEEWLESDYNTIDFDGSIYTDKEMTKEVLGTDELLEQDYYCSALPTPAPAEPVE